MESTCPFFTVDAFTKKPFLGNPAAVLLSNDPMDREMMQMIAREFNLSETAYPIPVDGASFKDADTFQLRWFTPHTEVSLCGHATLATTHVLRAELKNESKILHFQTQSGILNVSCQKDMYAMDFPQGDAQPISTPSVITEAFGISSKDVQETLYCSDPNKLIVVVHSDSTVRGLKPAFPKLISLSKDYDAGSIIVTAISSSGKYDFISRNFAPIRGVNEDPVTGSAHVILGPYWGKVLKKERMLAYQASSRGGEIALEMKDRGRILLCGNAVTISEGTMILPS